MNNSRVARRLEKVLVTIESVWVGIFLGVGLGLILDGIEVGYYSHLDGKKYGAACGIMAFVITVAYKRYIIKKEENK